MQKALRLKFDDPALPDAWVLLTGRRKPANAVFPGDVEVKNFTTFFYALVVSMNDVT